MNLNNELLIIILNLTILTISYSYIYPKFVVANKNKLIINSVISISLALIISGLNFADGEKLNMIIFKTNWFTFTLISYFILEIPFAVKYIKKYNLFKDL